VTTQPESVEPDAIAEVAGEEILPVPDAPEPAASAGDPDPREFEFPERLLVDDLDEITDWAEENGVPLQPNPVRSGWLRYVAVAATLLALIAYTIVALA
jgi:hypothetical protein